MVAVMSTPPKIQAKQQLSNIVKILLSRVYQDGIDRIIDIKVDTAGNITGYFQDETKLIKFTIIDNKISYRFSDDRKDSWISGLISIVQQQNHFDAKRNKPKNCRKGLSCGQACIDRNKSCEVSASTIASRAELGQLTRSTSQVAAFNSAGGVVPITTNILKPDQSIPSTSALETTEPAPSTKEKTTESNDLDFLSIRDLKKRAAAAGIYRYSYMTSEQLKQSIRTVNNNPVQQDRVRKTLERKKQQREALSKLPVVGSLLKTWKDLEKITKQSGSNPEAAALLAGAFFLGVSQSIATKVRDRYQSGLEESAQIAITRAQSIKTDNTNKPNLLYTVGGFSGTGSTGQRLQELLETPQDSTKGEGWFNQSNHIIPFSHKEFDIPTPSASKRNPNGSYNPVYLGAVASSGFGKFVQNVKRGRNEAAVDLAASMYAHGSRYKKGNINVLGHGVGGNVVREATEILNKMKSEEKGAALGSDIVKRLSVVNLGTPYFGFTNGRVWNSIKNRTITSSQDPFSILPKKMPQWISTVKGHEPDDYLRNSEVRDRLREAFGYYSSSITGRRVAEERKQAVGEAVGEALNVAYPPLGKVWNQLSKIEAKSKGNPTAGAILTGVVLTGASVKAYQLQQERHKKAINGYADEAKIMADDMTVPHVSNSSVMFTVGGAGATSEEIANLVKQNPELLAKNKVIPFDIAGFEPLKSGGIDPQSPQYLGYVAREEYGRTLKRTLSNKNPEAIRLASQIYAYAETSFKQNEGEPKYLPINLLGYGGGGVAAREAMEIVREMPNGKALSEHIRLVNLSTPSFGLVNPEVREKQYISKNDPFKILPRPNNKARSSIEVDSSDRTVASYLSNQKTIKGIASTFAEDRKFTKKGRVVDTPTENKRQVIQANKSKFTNRSGSPRDPLIPEWFLMSNTGPDDPRKQLGWDALPEADAAQILLRYKRRLQRERNRDRELMAITKETKKTRTAKTNKAK